MKMKYLAIIAFLLLITMIACKSLQNEGGADWATVEFSVDGSSQSNAHYASSSSSIRTALIIAVSGDTSAVGIADYLTDFFDRQLQDLAINTVNLRIPLNTPMRLVKVVF